MKYFVLILFAQFSIYSTAQKKEKINIPERVEYKYCSGKKFGKAKEVVLNELVKNDPTYSLVSGQFIIGPVMWERIGVMDEISEITGGSVDLHVNKVVLKAKMIQDLSDGKIVWNQIRSEFDAIPMRLRKATYNELNYFWTIIFYDIEEPLIIAETIERVYILDLDPKTFKLIWLDEVPSNLGEWYDSVN